MSNFEIFWVATENERRDYYDRQILANAEKCDLYVEHHFNAKEYDREGLSDNPSFCLVGSNASNTSKSIARTYSSKVAEEFGTADNGAVQCEYKGRGDGNLRHTSMPAILMEPLFISDLELAKIAQSEEGQRSLARILVETIKEHFPDGGRIAFSVGHLFKVSQPYDRGAPVAGTDGKVGEADLAFAVLLKAEEMITQKEDQAEEIFLKGSWQMMALDGGILLRKTNV